VTKGPKHFRVVVLSVLLLAVLGASSSTLVAEPPDAREEPESISTTGKVKLAQAWIRELFGSGMAPGIPDREPERGERLPDHREQPSPRERPAPSYGTYRTVCVRLCDGFYFPISFSTSRPHFSRDAQRCEQSCPKRSRLFVHPTGVSDEPAHMTDLQGKHYADLPNAYRSQKEYVADCTCRGNPWDPQEVARHQAYADANTARKSAAGNVKSSTVGPRRERAVADREQ
jgi:hypothetical protein